MRWIPAARSKKWWGIAAVSALTTSVALIIIRFGLLGQTLTGTHVFRFALLGIVLSLIFSAIGWLGGRLFWLLSNVGMLLGLIFMAAQSNDMSGWEDLISLLSFMMLTAGGIAAGLAAELVYWIIRRLRR